jgi:hypothetical protein
VANPNDNVGNVNVETLQAALTQLIKVAEGSREEAAEKEKQERLRRSYIDFLKAQHDFAKQLMTFSLAAVAALGALLAGAFSDPAPWEGSVVPRWVVILVTFGGFVQSMIHAHWLMRDSAFAMLEVGDLETTEELSKYRALLDDIYTSIWIWAPFGIGISGLTIFVVESVESVT